jgi:hypothetical protein
MIYVLFIIIFFSGHVIAFAILLYVLFVIFRQNEWGESQYPKVGAVGSKYLPMDRRTN